ncbi:presqualene diphosphate synthase HpnD [Xanthobacteraceae bacterium Astr-EGSB]|uniref:presqualene diphosphate synthase HpnD n=1 Tax=Astrobacterium formosum TaxID=3069710 RepID=UPI0027B71A76|nr:presqualene diphosphate synthase HpnD [Xanthobacteraceae bacterium Astr-EGSB]
MSQSSVPVAATDEAEKRASGSSFYTAMRILPKPQRQAMYEIYSFCRAVDDIADDGGDRGVRAAKLDEWRRDIDALYRGAPPLKLAGLAAVVVQFGMRREDFQAVIDGMAMDVAADIRAPDLATLDLYCDRVASAVGRLSIKVFGMTETEGFLLAHHLGRALQLTNILRDIDEDAGIGRLYLPREDLEAAGVDLADTDPKAVLAQDGVASACQPMLARAREHFAEADKVMHRTRRRVVKAPRIMSAAYKAYHAALTKRGFAPPRERVRLAKPRLLWIILRYAII